MNAETDMEIQLSSIKPDIKEIYRINQYILLINIFDLKKYSYLKIHFC